jgi:hypothetical protein
MIHQLAKLGLFPVFPGRPRLNPRMMKHRSCNASGAPIVLTEPALELLMHQWMKISLFSVTPRIDLTMQYIASELKRGMLVVLGM